jgi:hypothetical protein
MTPDEGRLELDDDGRVLDAAGPVRALDLHDPHHADDLATSGVQRWVDSSAAPFVRRHRRAVASVAAVAVAAAGVGLWAATRPPVVMPVLDVSVRNAVLAGNSIGGPEISYGGVLSIAFAVRSAGTPVDVRSLDGPGIASSTVAGEQVGDRLTRVEAQAQLDCTDSRLASATPTSYSLAASTSSPDGTVVDGVVPLTATGPDGTTRIVTRLDYAIQSWCLAAAAPDAVQAALGTVSPVPGTTLADVAIEVRNASPLPLTLASARSQHQGLAVDESPSVVLQPGGTGRLTTRVDVRDCSAAPSLEPLSALPNPGVGGASSPGLTLQIGLGGRTRLVSVPVADGGRLGGAVAATACAEGTAPRVSVGAVRGLFLGEGAWAVDAIVSVRTTGIGIGLARVQFAGPPAGEGSQVQVVTTDDGWAAEPVSLDGGAGRLGVRLASPSCGAVASLAPQALPVRVTMADRRVVPYQVVVDDVRVLQAAARACDVPVDLAQARARGWR